MNFEIVEDYKKGFRVFVDLDKRSFLECKSGNGNAFIPMTPDDFQKLSDLCLKAIHGDLSQHQNEAVPDDDPDEDLPEPDQDKVSGCHIAPESPEQSVQLKINSILANMRSATGFGINHLGKKYDGVYWDQYRVGCIVGELISYIDNNPKMNPQEAEGFIERWKEVMQHPDLGVTQRQEQVMADVKAISNEMKASPHKAISDLAGQLNQDILGKLEDLRLDSDPKTRTAAFQFQYRLRTILNKREFSEEKRRDRQMEIDQILADMKSSQFKTIQEMGRYYDAGLYWDQYMVGSVVGSLDMFMLYLANPEEEEAASDFIGRWQKVGLA